jgi:hypothetical protein
MAFHLYDIVEIYSNADGTQQFIELRTTAAGQNFLQGHQIRYTNGVTTNTFTFDHNLLPTTKSTANTTVLIGTEGWAELGLVAPDYIVENNFLVTTGGTINFGLNQDTDTFSILPTTDNLSENRAGTESLYSPTNFAGDSVMYGTDLGNNNMSGGAGKDKMFGLGGNDTLNGGVGNDTLIWDFTDSRVDGGGGTTGGTADTLTLLDGAGDLDLVAISNKKILNVERIDMTNGDENTLTVNARDVLDISTQSNTLVVFGNAGDGVVLSGAGWVALTPKAGFEIYKNGKSVLKVEEELNVLMP